MRKTPRGGTRGETLLVGCPLVDGDFEVERLLKIVITTTTMALAGLAILVCGYRDVLGML
jgi:hypothetical protein